MRDVPPLHVLAHLFEQHTGYPCRCLGHGVEIFVDDLELFFAEQEATDILWRILTDSGMCSRRLEKPAERDVDVPAPPSAEPASSYSAAWAGQLFHRAPCCPPNVRRSPGHDH